MRILALNIRHGGGNRIEAIARYIGAFHPDVVVLSEFRDNANANLLRAHFGRQGLPFFAAASAVRNQNSVCIASRIAFIGRAYPQLGPDHCHRLIAAHFDDLTVYGVYFAQRQAKSTLFDFLLAGPPSADPAALLVGDFNTGRHYVDEAAATFHCARQFELLSRGPYVDCWRSRNPDARQFSWFADSGRGFRIDHVFATTPIDARVTSIRYDRTPLTQAITDHAALIVECASATSRDVPA